MKNMSDHQNSERPPPEGCGAGFPTGKCLPELGQTFKTDLNKCPALGKRSKPI